MHSKDVCIFNGKQIMPLVKHITCWKSENYYNVLHGTFWEIILQLIKILFINPTRYSNHNLTDLPHIKHMIYFILNFPFFSIVCPWQIVFRRKWLFTRVFFLNTKRSFDTLLRFYDVIFCQNCLEMSKNVIQGVLA